jgi:hypothetical protein
MEVIKNGSLEGNRNKWAKNGGGGITKEGDIVDGCCSDGEGWGVLQSENSGICCLSGGHGGEINRRREDGGDSGT